MKTIFSYFTSGLIIAVAVVVISGLTQPKEVAAQSCETVDLGNFGVRSSSVDDRQGPNPGGDTDGLVENDFNLEMSDYIDANQYVSDVSILGETSASAGSDGDASAQSFLRVSVDGSPEINISSDDESEPLSASFTDSYSEGDSINTITVEASAFSSARAFAGERVSSGGSADADISLTACDTPSTNRAPVARRDGTTNDPLSVQGGEVRDLDVLFNDGQGGGSDVDIDGDSLTIDSVTNDNTAAQVNIIDGTKLRYNPGSLPNGATDQVSYTISDGNGGSDSATAYIKVSATGQVTVNADPDVSYTPWWKDQTNQLATREGEHTYTLPLERQPEDFGIERDDVTVGGVKTLPDSPQWIFKNPQVQDFTQSNNIIRLGLSYDETCEPNIPTAQSGQLNSFNSAGGDNVLILSSSNRSDLEGKCAVATGRLHPGYTSDISFANWIWQIPQDPAGPGGTHADNGAEVTFRKQFRVPDISKVADATIQYAADNYYELEVNGTQIDDFTAGPGNDGTEGYENDRIEDIESELTEGLNTVDFTITNAAGSPSGMNPAAGIFRIQVDMQPNTAPSAQANATFDSRVSASQMRYNLSASGSSDPDGDDLTYQWEVTDAQSNNAGQPANPLNASVADSNAENTTVVVSNPRSDTTITYTVELTVSDGEKSDTNSTTVSVSCDSSGGGSCAYDTGGGGGIEFE